MWTCPKQHISISRVLDDDLPDAFDHFFAHFESVTHKVSALQDSFIPQNDCVVCKNQVTALLKKTNIQKFIIPVLKTANPSVLNEFRPVTLTSLVGEIFERTLRDEITSFVCDKPDPSQFMYHS